MTAFLVVRQADALHLLTDTGVYDRRGNIIGFQSHILRVAVDPNRSVVITTRGCAEVGRYVAALMKMLAPRASTKTLLNAVSGIVRVAVANYEPILGSIAASFECCVLGGDAGQFGVHYISASQEVAKPGADATSIDPFVLYEILDPYFERPTTALQKRAAILPTDEEKFDPATHGVAWFEWVRSVSASFNELGSVRATNGAVQLTTIDRTGVAPTVTLHRWPDFIGQSIVGAVA
jgi:hypothetical protein